VGSTDIGGEASARSAHERSPVDVSASGASRASHRGEPLSGLVIRPFPAYVSDQHLRTYTIRQRLSGGSDVDATGSLDRLVVGASGGSDLDLSDLVVDSMVMAASGGSDVAVNVTGEIVGNASGGSNLTIRGEPARQDIEVSGGAEVGND